MWISELEKAEKFPRRLSNHDIKLQTKYTGQRMAETFLLHFVNLKLTTDIRLYFLRTLITTIKLKGTQKNQV